jgi:hypothetical protein
MQHEEGPKGWFKALMGTAAAREKRRRAGIIITVWWLLWKERNKRIFELRSASIIQLSNLIQDNISLLQSAGVMPHLE